MFPDTSRAYCNEKDSKGCSKGLGAKILQEIRLVEVRLDLARAGKLILRDNRCYRTK